MSRVESKATRVPTLNEFGDVRSDLSGVARSDDVLEGVWATLAADGCFERSSSSTVLAAVICARPQLNVKYPLLPDFHWLLLKHVEKQPSQQHCRCNV